MVRSPSYYAALRAVVVQAEEIAKQLDAAVGGLVVERAEAYDRGRAEEREDVATWLAACGREDLSDLVRRGRHRPKDAADRLEHALKRWGLK